MKKRMIAMVMALTLCLGLTGTAFAGSGQKTVHASTAAELEAAVQESNTKITLDAKDYRLNDLSLYEVDNVTIEGKAGTRILGNDLDNTVFWIYDCQNISIVNVVGGHEPAQTEQMSCQAGVVYAYESTVSISGCDLFGCGLLGLESKDSTVTVTDSTIRDCSRKLVEGSGTITFTNCTFSGNGYNEPDKYGIEVYGSSSAFRFDSCVFKNNKNSALDNSSENTNISITYNNCFFSGNTWGNDTKATRTASSVLVNGEKKNFDAYSIGGNNYFKLRDLAYVLNGTEKQFGVGWNGADNAITLTSGAAYTPVGGEMAAGSSAAPSVAPASAKVLVDGKEVSLTAYSIGGNNYFKLRDIGELFNFGVGWDGATSTITIDTTTGYTAG